MRVHLYERADRRRPTGVLYWIHGGGFVIGDAEMSHGDCAMFAEELNVLVVSIDYRLAAENPFPGGIEDCYAGCAGSMITPRRSASTGTGSRGGRPLLPAAPVYPVLDDRTVLRADHGGTGEFIWSPASNGFGCTYYRGRDPILDTAPEYAAAALAGGRTCPDRRARLDRSR